MPFSLSITTSSINTSVSRPEITASTVNTILQCFVDQNLQLDENVNFNYTPPTASFDFYRLNINEGATMTIRVSLDNPSVLGIEELDLYFINPSLSGIILPGDLSLSFPTTEPLRISWSAGEQDKFVSITANDDFFIEGIETFQLKLDHFVNCNSGMFPLLDIHIQNTTVFREVGIESTNGSIIIPVSDGAPFDLIFNTLEGTSKDIFVSLDSPSVFGIEEVDLIFSPTILSGASTNDYVLSTPEPIRLTWSIGEQTKIINFSALSDTNYFESQEGLTMHLANPAFAVISPTPTTMPTGIVRFPSASIFIQNITIDFEYTRLHLGPFATQPGRIATYPGYNLFQPYGSYATNYDYSQNHSFFLYQPTAPDQFVPSFSPASLLNNFNKKRLKIGIKNTGNYPVLYNNLVWNTGQTLYFTANTLNYFVDLPANYSQFLTVSGTTTIIGSSYDINMEMTYTGNGPNTTYYYGEFKLKDLSNAISTNKTIAVGNELFNSFPQSIFSTNTNSYYLITKFANVGTGRSGTSCPIWGFSIGTQENAAVDGLYFLDTYSTTDYIGLEFRQGGGINPTCTSTTYNIPYEILP